MPTGQFSCNSCQKTYAWKPQLAGKRVKCKCGSPISVPSEDPALADAPPAEFEDFYALAQGEAVDEPVAAPPPVARAAPALAVAGAGASIAPAPVRPAKRGGGGAPVGGNAGAGRRPNLLGYAQMGGGRKRLGTEEEGSGDVYFHPVKDVYIPAGLIVLGTVLSIFYLLYNEQVSSLGTAIFAFSIFTLFNLLITIPGILLTIRLFDLGIGPLGPGLLKLAACAIAPGAIGDVISMFMTGSLGGYIGWCISVGIAVFIFMKLLDFDFIETLFCASIIFVVRTWIVYALMIALFSSVLGPAFRGGFNPFGGGGGGGGRANLAGELHVDEDESLDGIRAKEIDEETLQMLVSPGGVNGKEWIEAAPNRTLAGQSRERSLEIMRAFDAAGVKEVRVWPRKDAKGNEMVNLMIVCPLEEKAARGRVVDQLKKLAKDLRRTAFRDRGEKYFLVRMMTAKEENELDAATGGTTPVGGGIQLKKGAAAEDPDE